MVFILFWLLLFVVVVVVVIFTACPGGTYGYGCSNNCSCGGGGNTCNKMNGTCICNPCYAGDSCETGKGFTIRSDTIACETLGMRLRKTKISKTSKQTLREKVAISSFI